MKIEAYGMDDCVWCDRLKMMFDRYLLKYTYKTIDVTNPEDEGTKKFIALGLRSVPQVWIDGRYIGGYEKTKGYIIDNELGPYFQHQYD